MQKITLEPIGWLRTPFLEKFGTPRQGHLVPTARARVQWRPGVPAEQWLQGLEGFSHAWLISYFHYHDQPPLKAKIHPPRLGGKSVGLLASRAPHRPNPIGLTLANIQAVSGRDLVLSGVDLVDGTPLLDLKPYVTEADRPLAVRGGWVEQHPWQSWPVTWSAAAEASLERIYRQAAPPLKLTELKLLAEQTLAHDPRSIPDRDLDARGSRPERQYWVRLYDVDFGFQVIDSGVLINRARFALNSALYARFESQQHRGDDQPERPDLHRSL